MKPNKHTPKFFSDLPQTYSLQSLLRNIAIFLMMIGLNTGTGLAKNRGDRKENIETLKIAFITKSLELTPEEARQFWPVYNQYETEIEALRSSRRKARTEARADFSTMKDAEAEKFIDGEMAFRQSELDLQKKYHILFKKVLPVKKVVLLYRAEEEFKQELIKKLQEMKQAK